MEPPPEPALQSEADDSNGAGRAIRALAWIAISLVVIVAAGVGYLHPVIGFSPAAPHAPRLDIPSGYQLSAMDFVNPSTGWIVAVFDDGDFQVLGTTDGGQRWTPELSGPTGGHGTFMKFFDARDGVFALVGSRPLLYRTADGGASWTDQAVLPQRSTVVSWTFADQSHGWMLVDGQPGERGEIDLFRTEDAGQTWVELGPPVVAPDVAFAVTFSDLGTGWLTTASTGAYAYRSGDLGATWKRVALPAPSGGWPRAGSMLVSPQPTGSGGVVVSVAAFGPAQGRSGAGATVVQYPPLITSTYDGGAKVWYTYGVTVLNQPGNMLTSSDLQLQAPDQAQLVSVDGGATWRFISLPAAPGAIGILDQWHWWWIGSGRWSKTSDAGAHWTAARNLGVPEPLAGSLQILDAQHAWFAASAGSRALVVSTYDGGLDWRTIPLPVMTSRVTP